MDWLGELSGVLDFRYWELVWIAGCYLGAAVTLILMLK